MLAVQHASARYEGEKVKSLSWEPWPEHRKMRRHKKPNCTAKAPLNAPKLTKTFELPSSPPFLSATSHRVLEVPTPTVQRSSLRRSPCLAPKV